jgi:hypothetical protein
MAPSRGPPSGPRKRERREPGSDVGIQSETHQGKSDAPVRVTDAAIDVGSR